MTSGSRTDLRKEVGFLGRPQSGFPGAVRMGACLAFPTGFWKVYGSSKNNREAKSLLRGLCHGTSDEARGTEPTRRL